MRGGDDGGIPWFSRQIGTTYPAPGAGTEIPLIAHDDDKVFFEIDREHDPDTGELRGAVIFQEGSLDASYRNADAMRNHARVLLEVADEVDRALGAH